MPARIDLQQCDGCRGNPEPPCVRSCPGDVLDKDHIADRARVRCAGECWDCYACVKACPQTAIQVELPYALARRTGSLVLVDHHPHEVLWDIHWADGRITRMTRPGHVDALRDEAATERTVFQGGGI